MTAADTGAINDMVNAIQQWLEGINQGDPGAAQGLSNYLASCESPEVAHNAYNTAVDSFNHKLGGDIVTHVPPPAPHESLQHYVQEVVQPQIYNTYNEIHETNVDASNNLYNTGTVYGGIDQESDPTVATDGGFAQGGHDNTNTATNTNTGDVGGNLNQADNGSNAGSPGGVANTGTQTGVNTGDGGTVNTGDNSNVAGGHFGAGSTAVQNSTVDHSAVGAGASQTTDSHDTTITGSNVGGDVQGGQGNTQEHDQSIHEDSHNDNSTHTDTHNDNSTHTDSHDDSSIHDNHVHDIPLL